MAATTRGRGIRSWAPFAPVVTFAGIALNTVAGCGDGRMPFDEPPAELADDGGAPSVADDAATPDGGGGGGGATCPAPPAADPLLEQREICKFTAGTRALDSLGGITADDQRALPIKHVIIVMQENRSFDHYF